MSEKLILLAAFVVSMLLMSINHRKKRKKIVFFGDSITKLGARPGGYITHIVRLLKEAEIEYNYELAGTGVDGDTAADLYQRVDEDILSEGADIVVIFVGIIDVGHKFNGAEKEFETAYEAIIKKLNDAVIKIVLCTPVMVSEKIVFSNGPDVELNKYCNTVRELAAKHNLPLADIRKAFLSYNPANNIGYEKQGMLTFDGIHLNDKGNQLIAEEMWKVLKVM